MKPQRHVWVITQDECPIINRTVWAYRTAEDAENNLEEGEKVVKYVPENKALVEAAKEVVACVHKGPLPSNIKTRAVIKNLKKALEAK